MYQLTLRGIPKPLRHRLRTLAKERRQSMNAVAVGLLEEALGQKPRTAKRRDLSALAGRWSAAEVAEIESRLAPCRQIDEEMWQA